MRPIDADALHKAYMELRNFKQDPQSGDWISLRAVPLTTVIRMLNEAPTIEPKHGEWIRHEERTEINGKFIDFFPAEYECSNCGFKEAHYFISDYCPNCGADMRNSSEKPNNSKDEPQTEDAYAYDEDDWYDKAEREGE